MCKGVKAGYKFDIDGKQAKVYFYKYAGLYFFMLHKDGWQTWKYLLNQDVCHQSMNKLKRMFDVKPIKYSKNKKHNIELSPAGTCLFDCHLCDSILFLRNEVWELDDRWHDCETQGIHLQTDRQCEFSWREPPYNIEKHEFDMDNDVIKSAEEFRKFIIINCIGCFGCDICKKSNLYDDIYFCKQCEEVCIQYNLQMTKNNEKNDDDQYEDDNIKAPDVFNLCKECYTESNIKAHADTCNNYCGFYMKPTTY
jgi:hypothetical protein